MAKAKKFFWKVWLRLNLLTTESKTDYVAEIDATGKTLYNEDVALRIKEEGSELQLETLINIINRADRIRIQALLESRRVQTLLTHMSPRVPGTWEGATAHFDPEKNRPTLDMTLTAEMREALEEVGVTVLGVKETDAIIGMVTDAATGNVDGTVTAGDDIIIDGIKIKIVPEDDETCGVFFVDTAGTEYRVTHRYTQNTPKRVIARVPAELAAGDYTLKIVTRFSANTQLKESRTITYNLTLNVE
jgi:hypothetical protein